MFEREPDKNEWDALRAKILETGVNDQFEIPRIRSKISTLHHYLHLFIVFYVRITICLDVTVMYADSM